MNPITYRKLFLLDPTWTNHFSVVNEFNTNDLFFIVYYCQHEFDLYWEAKCKIFSVDWKFVICRLIFITFNNALRSFSSLFNTNNLIFVIYWYLHECDVLCSRFWNSLHRSRFVNYEFLSVVWFITNEEDSQRPKDRMNFKLPKVLWSTILMWWQFEIFKITVPSIINIVTELRIQ